MSVGQSHNESLLIAGHSWLMVFLIFDDTTHSLGSDTFSPLKVVSQLRSVLYHDNHRALQ